MKGRLKSIFIIIIALFVAIATGFYLVPKDMEKTRQTTMVVRLKENIGKNQKVKNEHVEVIEIGSYNLPKYIVTDSNEIIGKYAMVPMHKDEFAIGKYFQDKKIPDEAFLYEDTSVDGISFETDLSKCVGGIPKKGDQVRVIIYKQARDRDTESQVLTYDELSKLEVIKVANKNGISIEDAKSGNANINNSIVPGVVTVKADIKQQQLLVKGIYDGTIHLALRPRVLVQKKETTTDDEGDKNEIANIKGNKELKETKEAVEDKVEDSLEDNKESQGGGFIVND